MTKPSSPAVKLESSAVDDDRLVVTRVRVREALSRLFEVKIDLHIAEHGDALDDDALAALLHERATLVVEQEDEPVRYCGVVRAVAVSPTKSNERARYRVTLVPTLWLASQTRRSRVFLDKTAPEIVEEIFEELTLVDDEDYRFELEGTYRKREYTAQYNESDFQFVARLLEDEGIFFFFEHEERDCVVIADHNNACEEVDELVFEHGNTTTSNASLLSIGRRTRRLPARLLVFDYNWRKPSLDFEGTASLDPRGVGVVALSTEHWTRGDAYSDPTAGNKAAQLRAEELLATRDEFSLVTNRPDVRVGARAKLENGPQTMFERTFLITEARHEITLPVPGEHHEHVPSWTARLTAIDDAVVFRPPRVTPKPRIDGVIYGVIDAPDEQENAYLDDRGRYKVWFPFNVALSSGAEGEEEEGGSAWIRRAQPYAGASIGHHFPLLPGTEVVIAHVDGDPDRPVILGAVFNEATPNVVTSKSATSNIIRTASGVRMHFEDEA